MTRFATGARAIARRWPAIACAVVLAAAPAAARAAAEEALPASLFAYRIEARLDPEARTVSGSLHARWRNTGRAPATALYLHLYLNAFASNRTTLMTELGDEAERWWRRHPDGWGRIDVATLRVDGRDVLAQMAFVQPDDGNADDRTLVRVTLPAPVPPRASVEVESDFVATLPRLFMRSGHAAPFFFVAQWFPKLAVLGGDGIWHAHQYHAASEFFADFATYDVTLTVPADDVVGATGVTTGERDNGDGTRTLTVHAEAVHDFAWTADPRFRVVEERIGDVPVRLLVQPHHLAQAPRYLGAVRAALIRSQEWFGPFPYPQLTVVDPGPGGLGAGGMEYPMLVTVGTAWWMPAGVRIPEVVAVHELGHQYWYAMLATDEVDEAWLDEGINSYVEGLIMDEAYGPGSYLDLLGLQVDAVPLARASYLASGSWDPIATPSYRMLDREAYVGATYAKTNLALRTLGGLLGGQDRVIAALGAYARRYRFGHPTERDFRAAFSAATGGAVDGVLDQLLHDTGTLDYAVARIEVHAVPPELPSASPSNVPSAESPRYRSEVVIERRGTLRVPVDIRVVYDDGGETRETWDGQGRWYRIDVTSTRQATYAVVDPDDKLPLDVDRLNNSRLREPGTRGLWRLGGRWGLWLQGALLALSGL
ncbi:MAG TPA: M1 family metallopeptidase [Candidatus Dormibacteraeota bacterium]|nr:M1 family metallopeptidase [Candidatus Dormibacteraeota bacterium]